MWRCLVITITFHCSVCGLLQSTVDVVRNGNCNKVQLLVLFLWPVLSEDTIKYGHLLFGKKIENEHNWYTHQLYSNRIYCSLIPRTSYYLPSTQFLSTTTCKIWIQEILSNDIKVYFGGQRWCRAELLFLQCLFKGLSLQHLQNVPWSCSRCRTHAKVYSLPQSPPVYPGRHQRSKVYQVFLLCLELDGKNVWVWD